MSFSVIIPFYNAQDFLPQSVQSVLNQLGKFDYEIILVDDGSSDTSYRLATKLKQNHPEKIHLYSNPQNLGPGIARNLGIKNASKDWIIFLDSDDSLKNNLFIEVQKQIQENPLTDLISYDFDYAQNTAGGGGKYMREDMRKDMLSLKKPRLSLIKDYISLQMDGSAIFTAFRKNFLLQNNILFTQFFHEDVYFMFQAYYHANHRLVIEKKLYTKSNRKHSIVNSIDTRHIDGFFNAYDRIYQDIYHKKELLESYVKGIVGVFAIKIRDINAFAKDKMALYEYLYKKVAIYKQQIPSQKFPQKFPIETKYFKIFNLFVNSFKNNQKETFQNALQDLLEKSWSCYDLHHSIFLAPDEIRACCKRFFVGGVKKGDVILHKIAPNTPKEAIYNQILTSKQKLFSRINAGNASECNGCPHLEFKKWEKLDRLKFERISFEYHSICNMRCVYCSEKYYGGKAPLYDVAGLIDLSIENGAFSSCKSIVWGGGEPTIEKSFDPIITKVATQIPFKQMVITNALKHSPTLQNLIDNNQATITTSIDAGNEANFKQIRGANGLQKVFKNLALYAKNNPSNITIKYILMPNNHSKAELEDFVSQIKSYSLQQCNFHISCNFNEASVQEDIIKSAIILYALIQNIGAKVLFFDELLRMRIAINSPEELETIKKYLQKMGLDSVLESPSNYQKVCIWGSGIQTQILLKKSIFFSKIPSVAIIDSNSEMIGKTLMNKTIKAPKDFLEDNCPILISAVQGTPRIYQEFLQLGFDEKRLIKGIIL
ncbi:glycosyltransferase [Helicobacter sp. 11S02596-1]|uniref:glycosyltransferase n=1 Tax=Helicobacter sp. 11S02596-1 TaxID=1476194 RepID=UPI000BA68AE7|nr:glycosyltransferase [Helicobacter sp. 11S02596-1]PAF45164.1 hypothetical protein BJI48_00945 [Helicobacter sp. 11S02596-1]